MRSGLYAVISLDGAPVDATEAAALGLSAAGRPVAARGVDAWEPDVVHAEYASDRVTILLGRLDDAAEAVHRLGLPEDTPPVALARAALDRHGAEAARMLRGEWSLLDWTSRATVLLGSLARRDWLLYAHCGNRLAIAPDLDRLSRLAWVGRTIDPDGFAFAVGRATMRRAGGDSTILRGVRKLAPGTLARIDTSGVRLRSIPPFLPVAPFRGDFAEAMAQAAALLRTVMRERLRGAGDAACMLSGGLDSSLLATLAAQERDGGRRIVALCSSAAPDSALRDESSFAQVVADRLGLPLERVVPPGSASPYALGETALRAANGPSLAGGHYVYSALDARAAALSLPRVFDGSFGEMTVTSFHPIDTVANRVRALWHRLRGRREPPDTGEVLHVRLAPHRMAAARRLADAVGVEAAPAMPPLSPRAPWGVLPGAEAMNAETSAGSVARRVYPFRDPRLLALFAAFPAGFMEHDDVWRAPARHLLRGHLPDAIRLRRIGMPFSPDAKLRLVRHAPAALARVGVFRAGGLDEWIDLDWLAEVLGRAAGGSAEAGEEAQLTAMTAEYLLAWQVAA